MARYRGGGMTRTRFLDYVAVAVAITVVVALGYVTRSRDTPPRIDQVRALTAAVEQADSAPTALFIGDSYTSGNGFAEMSYACQAARQMEWICKLGAEPGTGFISGGTANRSFGEYTGPTTSIVERIPRLALMYRPDYVVLDGGRNDTFAPLDRVFNAMSTAIASVRRAWPNATLIFIRPRHLNRPGDDLGFDDAFIENLRLQDAPYSMAVIDPLALLVGQDVAPMLRPDGEHPNEAGVAALAAALTATLRSSGLPVRA